MQAAGAAAPAGPQGCTEASHRAHRARAHHAFLPPFLPPATKLTVGRAWQGRAWQGTPSMPLHARRDRARASRPPRALEGGRWRPLGDKAHLEYTWGCSPEYTSGCSVEEGGLQRGGAAGRGARCGGCRSAVAPGRGRCVLRAAADCSRRALARARSAGRKAGAARGSRPACWTPQSRRLTR